MSEIGTSGEDASQEVTLMSYRPRRPDPREAILRNLPPQAIPGPTREGAKVIEVEEVPEQVQEKPEEVPTRLDTPEGMDVGLLPPAGEGAPRSAGGAGAGRKKWWLGVSWSTAWCCGLCRK